MKKVEISNIEKEKFEGLVYNLELNGIEKKDDLFWIDGKTGLITHNCFPKDVLALKTTAQQNNYNFKLLEATIEANILQKRVLFNKILKKYGYGSTILKDKTVAIWGLAFKPQTDDIREAPALEIIDNLLRVGATVKVFDPEAIANVEQIYGETLQYYHNQYDVLEDADFLVIATEWNEFRSPDFDRIKTALKEHVIFDGRNLYDLENMRNHNIEYHSIGR